MNRRQLLAAGAGLLAVPALPIQAAEPVRLIFDTDIGPDVDDAGALAVLHALASRGEARLLAMGCCTSSPDGATCIDAINTFYGRPEIPVGAWKGSGFLTDSKYNGAVAKRFPHRLARLEEAPDAPALYRRVLAKQPDQSVVMVAVGPLNNLAWLLASGPDAASKLVGRELVAKKVRLLSVMGGRFPEGKEWNFEQDPAGAAKVCAEWPTPILFSGFEIGARIFTGKALAQAPADHAVRVAYEHYVGPGKARESWDLTSCLAAVRGDSGLWEIRKSGTVTVDVKTGANRWTETAGGRHSYLVETAAPQQVAAELERLMLMPPKRG